MVSAAREEAPGRVDAVRGRYILTQEPGERVPRVRRDSALAYSDGRVIAVDSWDEIRNRYDLATVYGGDDDIVVPGFVNGHHHVGVTPFQLGAPDLPLELWSVVRNGALTVDPYLDTIYAGAEMLRSGITTVHHIQTRLGPTSGWQSRIDSVLRAYADLGLRVCFSVALRDQGLFVQGDDDQFLATLPPDLARQARSSVRDAVLPYQEHLDRYFVDLFNRFDRNTRADVRIHLAPTNLHWCSDAALTRVAELSERYGAGVHIHLLETALQRVYGTKRNACGAVRALERVGLLSDRLTIGHAVWSGEDDLELMARESVQICHNASSNLRLHSGIAPFGEFRRRGIPVSIGIDEASLHDDRDMLAEIRLVHALHQEPGLTTVTPNLEDIWEAATRAGSQSCGYGNQVGAIRVGGYADACVANWRAVCGPFLDDRAPVLDAFLRRARPHMIHTVLVNGRPVLIEGRLTGVDEDAANEELSNQLSVADRTPGLRADALADQLLPYLRQHYAQWENTAMPAPFQQYSAR